MYIYIKRGGGGGERERERDFALGTAIQFFTIEERLSTFHVDDRLVDILRSTVLLTFYVRPSC